MKLPTKTNTYASVNDDWESFETIAERMILPRGLRFKPSVLRVVVIMPFFFYVLILIVNLIELVDEGWLEEKEVIEDGGPLQFFRRTSEKRREFPIKRRKILLTRRLHTAPT